MRLHEKIEIRLISTNHVLDMLNDHIDLGVKINPLAGDEVMMTQVGKMRMVVCASPEYLAAKPCPSIPEDITDHETITFSRSCDQAVWSFNTSDGKSTEIQVKSKLVVNTAEAVVESALRGSGLTQLYLYQAAPQIESGELKIILQDFEISAVPVCLAIPKGQNSPQKVKVFIDFTKPLLEQQLQMLNQKKPSRQSS